MKKNSTFINEEKGFILPLVLLIATLLFLFVSTNIAIYKNEMSITKNELDQIKIDTLFQMGRAKFKDDLTVLTQESGTVYYTFPNGNVEVSFKMDTEDVYELTFSVSTSDKLLIITNHMAKANE